MSAHSHKSRGASGQSGAQHLSHASTMPIPGAADETSDLTGAHQFTHVAPDEVSEDLHDSLCRAAIERGLAEQDEIDRCMQKLGRRGLIRGPLSLPDLLIKERVLTPRQLDRLVHYVHEQSSRVRLPGFKMLGPIGQGAHASVFKARQLSLDRLVAIKVLPKHASRNPGLIEQFRREGKAAAALNHANIVQAFDVASHGDVHYFVMEFVEGQTVHEILQKQGRFEEVEALDIIIAMADALAHAHERGLIHRDVKPKNIIITDRGIPKLADLGLALVLSDDPAIREKEGLTRGTPYFMSPEQVRGDIDMGPPTDIYSLGATFFYMVTGQVPFDGKTADEVMAKHTRETVRHPHEVEPAITEGVSEVIVKMMAKSPSDRYPDCGVLLTELRAWRAYHTLRKGESKQN